MLEFQKLVGSGPSATRAVAAPIVLNIIFEYKTIQAEYHFEHLH